jgi:hypothetical protein
VGVSTQEFGTICHWAVNLLNILTGNLDRVGGAMFTSPAIDAVGMGLIGRGHHGVWKGRVRGLLEFGDELPVSVLSEEIETEGEGHQGDAHPGRQTGALDARRRAPGPSPGRAGLHGGRRHLRQRDHTARRATLVPLRGAGSQLRAA